jgi:hypothetical protein
MRLQHSKHALHFHFLIIALPHHQQEMMRHQRTSSDGGHSASPGATVDSRTVFPAGVNIEFLDMIGTVDFGRTIYRVRAIEKIEAAAASSVWEKSAVFAARSAAASRASAVEAVASNAASDERLLVDVDSSWMLENTFESGRMQSSAPTHRISFVPFAQHLNKVSRSN